MNVQENAQAFRWTQEGGYQLLRNSTGYGVSGDGSVVVGYGQDGIFRWTESGGPQDFGEGTATSVSADGNVVVGRGSGAGGITNIVRWTAEEGRQFLGQDTANAISATRRRESNMQIQGSALLVSAREAE